MARIARALSLTTLALALAGHAGAQAVPPHGDTIFTPTPGQIGKDVMWLGSPEQMVGAMLRAARTGPGDLVVDLGAGDGRIPIAAARDFGARAIGIEYDPKMAALAARNAERAGVADRVRIIEGDLFKHDFSRATVLTLYLLPEINLQLRPQILDMAPGTRVVSNTFTMAEWEPDQTIKGATFDAYLWIVPAKVAGRWSISDEQGRPVGTVELIQRFQKLGGTLTLGGGAQVVMGAHVNGREFGFSYIDRDSAFRTARFTVDGDRAEGISTLGESSFKITARRG